MKSKILVLSCVALAFALVLAGCQTGSAVVVGKTRAPLSADQVKLYITPPKKYDVVGLVEATGKNGWSDQAKMNRAINELKQQAAKLGANGVLLSATGEKSAGVVGGTSGGMFYGGNVFNKTASGQAIFVTED